MGAAQFCASSGGCRPATEDGHSSCFARTAGPCDVTFTAGNGTAFRGGHTKSGAPIGVAGLVIVCATLPKVATYAAGVVGWRESWGAIRETCPALTCGFPACARHLRKRRKLDCAISGERSDDLVVVTLAVSRPGPRFPQNLVGLLLTDRTQNV
jgi:hypothetical protein